MNLSRFSTKTVEPVDVEETTRSIGAVFRTKAYIINCQKCITQATRKKIKPSFHRPIRRKDKLFAYPSQKYQTFQTLRWLTSMVVHKKRKAIIQNLQENTFARVPF